MRPPTRLVQHAHQAVAAAVAVVLVAGAVTATALLPGGSTAEPAAATDRTGLSAQAPTPTDPTPTDSTPTAPTPTDSTPTAPTPTDPTRSDPVRSVAAPPVGAPAVTAPAVAPLGVLRAADLVVTLRRPLRPAQVTALRAVRAVQAVAVVDAGAVQVGGRAARLVGVDPSQFRAFTPQETAASDALWQSVARGEVAPSFGLQRSRGLRLGAPLLLDGAADVTARIGAVAAYGLPGVDLVTDRATARRLGAVPASGVLVSAPGRRVSALRKAVLAVVGPDATVEVLRVEVARSTGRKTYRDLYVDGARYCPGLSWTVLAGIGQVESAHGRVLGPSSAGALGPMQFLPSTWAAYGVDGDGDGTTDIMSPYDAIPAAAGYLCRSGANRGPDGLYDAVFAYNHLDAYVQKVLATARAYGGDV